MDHCEFIKKIIDDYDPEEAQHILSAIFKLEAKDVFLQYNIYIVHDTLKIFSELKNNYFIKKLNDILSETTLSNGHFGNNGILNFMASCNYS